MSDATVLTVSGSGQTGVTNGGNLVTQIAAVVGGQSETSVRAQALDCLNRVRIEMNQHDWRFMQTSDNPITLIAGTQTYTLEPTFRKPKYVGLIDATGVKAYDLNYKDDAILSHETPAQTNSGVPFFYWMRNDFSDGLISLYPVPDVGCASAYRLQVEYETRIPQIADTSDDIALPEEAQNLLVIGGQAYLLRERDKASPVTVQAFNDYMRVKLLLLSNDRRIVDDRAHFTILPRRYPQFGTVLVKI